MAISKTYLPDINLWVALLYEGHAHNPVAIRWFDTVDKEAIAFCRITQMGLLRLLTNRKVMGEDVLSQAQAWEHYEDLCEDSRLTFFSEPAGIEEAWRELTKSHLPSANAWTDAYLAAFAKMKDLTLVSFDQAFRAIPVASVILSA